MAVLEIDSAPRCRVPVRFSPCLLVAVGHDHRDRGGLLLPPKAADHRSAFVRWRPQVLKFWEGVNVYDKFYFPNPPILPITLGPLMVLPPVAGAMAWFGVKVGADDNDPGALPSDREAARSSLSASSRARS